MSYLKMRHTQIAALGVCAALILPLLSGCSQSSSAKPAQVLPADSFRVTVKNLVANSSLTIIQVNIEKAGEGKVTVKGNEFSSENAFGSNQQQSAGLSRAETLICADLFEAKDKADNRLKLLIQTSSNLNSTGGPAIWPVPRATKVSDVLAITIQPGVYPLGTSLPLGTLQGNPVTLTVK